MIITSKNKVPYLYGIVNEKIEELVRKSPKMELDLETLKRDLPNKMRLTRRDINEVLLEMDDGASFKIEGRKIKMRGYDK
jgi:hypothetical protein